MKQIKQHKSIIIIIIIFLLIKIPFLFKFHEFFWDESVYIGIGKYIFSLGKIGLWESIRPPIIPIILGFFWKINLTFLYEPLIILITAGIIFLSYLITQKLFNKKIAIYTAIILLLTHIFFEYSSYILTSIPSTFFGLLALYFLINKNNYIISPIFLTISFLTRFPQGILFLSITLVYLLFSLKDKKQIKNIIKVIAIFILILSPYLIFNSIYYQNQDIKPIDKIFKPFIEASQHQSNIFESKNTIFYFKEIPKHNILFLFSLIGIFFFFKNKDYKDKNKTILFIIPLFFIIYLSIIVNKQLRFTIAFIPYLAIFSAIGINHFIKYIFKKRSILKYIFLLIILIIVINNQYDVSKDTYNSYRFRARTPPEIASEFYIPYISQLQEPILISDPTSIAYIDKKFIPYYQDLYTGNKIYEQNKNITKTIIYNQNPYPCLESDIVCKQFKQGFFEKINRENNLINTTEFYGEKYYIFSTLIET